MTTMQKDEVICKTYKLSSKTLAGCLVRGDGSEQGRGSLLTAVFQSKDATWSLLAGGERVQSRSPQCPARLKPKSNNIEWL